ncbi:HAMP domain-containing sensor histidine kinase [Streptomyces boninensis]|uniref:HAMP domain-containing sensor histidine kinase n=1 Tax=Streptomyces boninensis TaxID=2039455 RepID=UPI003B217722
MIARLNRLPLRSRLALLVAAAVAVAVAVVAMASWLITRDQLMNELDRSLRHAEVPNTLNVLEEIGCQKEKPERLRQVGLNPEGTAAQLVTPDGSTCWVSGEHTFPATDEDKQTAAATETPGPGRGPAAYALHTITVDGTDWRVFTRPYGGATYNDQPTALSIAKPMSEVTGPLSTLTWVLALVAGAGVIGSGIAGVTLARAGLRPVERLTGTVEHVAATEDLSVRIPVEGDDEIARLSRSFNAMTEALASSRERQQQLIADAGHELRTPLTSLRTNIELLARSEESGRPLPPEDKKELLTSVKAQMTELGALIGDLQELARPDTVPGARPPQVVGLHDIAQKAVSRARLRAADRVGVVAELAPWYVRAEPAALERAVVNLLDNAVKFSPDGAEVEVRIHPDTGELTVRDHGPGIPPDDLPHVFERFWRSPAHRGLPGSGLGLSIAARTVQQAGGAIELSEADGGGTLASVRIPGAPEEPPAPPPTDAPNGMPRTGEGPAED